MGDVICFECAKSAFGLYCARCEPPDPLSGVLVDASGGVLTPEVLLAGINLIWKGHGRRTLSNGETIAAVDDDEV